MTTDTGGDPRHPTAWRRTGRAAAAAAALAVPVAVLAWLVRSESRPLVAFDETAVADGTALARADPDLRRVLVVWEEVFQARWLNLAGALLCLWLWRARPALRRRIVWGVATVLVAWGLANLLKEVVRRARPVLDDAVADAPGWSFPSGHAMNTTAAAIALTVVVWPVLGRHARVVVPALAATAVVLTGVDRVMLGVHYPSDVVAGMLLGSGVVVGSYLGWVSPAEPHRTRGR